MQSMDYSLDSKTIIGIDPGQKGGLASVGGSNEATPMPLAGKELDALAIANWIKEQNPDLVVIEKVHSMPKQGVSSTFKFGKGYGIAIGVVQALGIPLIFVTPQAWKGRVLAGTTKDKAAAVSYVRSKYPHLSLLATSRSKVPHDGMADAVCIAEYGRKEVS
jgi:crossover junction endodeoxyribonuclease RuvC